MSSGLMKGNPEWKRIVEIARVIQLGRYLHPTGARGEAFVLDIVPRTLFRDRSMHRYSLEPYCS